MVQFQKGATEYKLSYVTPVCSAKYVFVNYCNKISSYSGIAGRIEAHSTLVGYPHYLHTSQLR